jgi:hypothetical protein
MNGGRTVTDDTCLYAEALALRTAQEQQSQVLLQNQLTLGLRYYFGVAPLPVSLLAGVHGWQLDRLPRKTLSAADVFVCAFCNADTLLRRLVPAGVSHLHCRCTLWLA